MSELIECIDGLTAEDIIRRIAKTANGMPFYLQTQGLAGFCSEYQRIYNDLEGSGTAPSDAVAAEQNTMVCGLIDDGVWAKLDVFYLFAQETNDGGVALMNWVTTGFYNATMVNPGNLTFTALEGIRGGGVNGYLRTHYNPFVNGVNYSLNSGCIGLYVRIGVSENKYDFAANSPYSSLKVDNGAGSMIFGINNAALSQDPVPSLNGIFMSNRIDAINVQGIHNTTITPFANASTTVTNWEEYIFTRNANGSPNTYSTKQFSVAWISSGLTQADVNNLNARIETYMDSNGKGILP